MVRPARGGDILTLLDEALRELHPPEGRIPCSQNDRATVRAVALLLGCREARPDEERAFLHSDLAPGGPAQLFVGPDGEQIVGHLDWYTRTVWWRDASVYIEAEPFTGPELDV